MINKTFINKIITSLLVLTIGASIISVNVKAADLNALGQLPQTNATLPALGTTPVADPVADSTVIPSLNPLQIGVLPDDPLNINGTVTSDVEVTTRDKNGKVTEIKKANKTEKDNLPDYYIKVNKKTNTVTVYLKKGEELIPYKAMVCSVGRNGHTTPEGTYKTSDYYEWRLMVDNTYGRYAVRFNKSIMFHSVPYYKTLKNSLEWEEYNKLGSPASLGCVRLAVADSKWIYDNCKRGTGVTVYSGDKSTDPLGKPEPIKLDTKSKHRDWDPTDLTKENPWLVTIED